MRSTPSWVHELVPTKHEGVTKIHLERVERKGTWTQCDTNSKTVLSFPLTCQGRFVRKRNLQSSQRKTASTQSGQLSESWLFGSGRSINAFFGEFRPILVQNHLNSKTELSWSDWKDQVPIVETEVLPAAVADRQDESSSSSDTSSSSSPESNT